MNQLSKISQSVLLLSFFEAWERFSYFGMRALLVLFLVQDLGFDDAKAYSIYAIFGAICYITPVVAGILADRYVGFQKVLIIGAAIMCLGHIGMTFSSDDPFFVAFGLAAIAIGTGFFKGNISNLMGSIYSQDDPHRNEGFTWFYVAINLGAAIAAVICGYVAHLWGWHWGFGVAGVGMFIGLVVFMRYRYILNGHGIRPNNPVLRTHLAGLSLLIQTILIAISLIALSIFLIYYSDFSEKYIPWTGILVLGLFVKMMWQATSSERQKGWALIILIFFTMAFFIMEMQLGALINLFTERNVDREVFGMVIPTSTLQTINPVTIIIFGAIFARVSANYSIESSSTRFIIGLLLNLLCFVTLYIGCKFASNGMVPLFYLVVSIVFMGIGELCIAPLIMSLMTLLAPARVLGFMMGVLMFCLSYANLAGIVVGKFFAIDVSNANDPTLSIATYQSGFYYIAILCAVLFGLFLLFVPFLNKRLKAH